MKKRNIKYKTPKYADGVQGIDPFSAMQLGGMPQPGGMQDMGQQGRPPSPDPVPTVETDEPLKIIEVEDGELKFRKTPSGKFVLEQDYKGVKPHSKGGEKIEAQEGTVIFPKDKRKAVLEAYDNNDNLRLETIRLSLPEDKPKKPKVKPVPKYATGTSGIETDWEGGLLGIDNFTRAAQQAGPYAIKPRINPLFVEDPAIIYPAGTAPASGNKTNWGGLANDLIGIAPSLYNLGRGIFGKPEQVARRTFTPQEYNPYFDITPQIRDVADARIARNRAAANYAGGNVGAVLSNINQSSVDAQKALADLRTQKFNAESGIRNRNVDLRNQAQLQNIGLQNQYDDLDARNREAKNAGIAEGLTGLSGYGQSRQRTRIMNDQARNQDMLLGKYNNMLMGLAQTQNYKAEFDPAGNLIFKFRNSGAIVPESIAAPLRQSIQQQSQAVPVTGDILGVSNLMGQSGAVNPYTPKSRVTPLFQPDAAPVEQMSTDPAIAPINSLNPAFIDVGASPSRVPIGVADTRVPLENYTAANIADKVIQAESSGRSGVTSNRGAMGLMQVMPDTWAEWAPRVGATNPMDPEDNRKVGVAYLNSLQKQFGGDMRLALIAYNWGPGNTQKWLRSGAEYSKLPKETRDYIYKILGERVG